MNIRERFRKLAELLSSYEDREGKLIEIDDQTNNYYSQPDETKGEMLALLRKIAGETEGGNT